jgi:hypothetical protein
MTPNGCYRMPFCLSIFYFPSFEIFSLIFQEERKSSQSLLHFLLNIPFLGMSNSACVCATYGVDGWTVSVS